MKSLNLRGKIFALLMALVVAVGSFAFVAAPEASQDNVVTAASVDYFLKIDGIDGESKDDKHKEWIDILSYQFGMEQTASTGGGGAGKVKFNELTFSKKTDKATPKLMEAIATGQVIPEIVLDVPQPAGKEAYLKITLENVLISSFSQAGDSSSAPTEQISLNYEKIKFEHTTKSGETGEFGWDVVNNVPLPR